MRYSVPPGFHLPRLDDEDAGLVCGQAAESRIESTFYDAEDLRIVRAGAGLEFRAGSGWLVTLPSPRPSVEPRTVPFEGRAGTVPEGAQRLLTALSRGAPLVPVARLSTWRRAVGVAHDGAEVAIVVDEEVSVLEGRRVAARFRTVALEAAPEAAPELIDAIHDRLVAAGAGEPERQSKLVRALGPPALRPPDGAPPALDGDADVATAVRAALAGPAWSLLAHDVALRAGDDPEAARKVRVAARRLRSLLANFSPLLEPRAVEELEGELGWLADAVSGFRDLEVRAARLRYLAGRLEDGARAPAEALAASAERAAAEARARLPEVLESPRYATLLERVASLSAEPPLLDPAAHPAAQVLASLARSSWKRLRKAVTALGPEPANDDLHRVRIRAKRARYAGEAVALVEPDAAAYVTAVEGIQTALGEQHDAVVTAEWIRAQAGTGRRAFIAGRLYELERRAAETSTADFRARWAAAPWKRLRKWM